MQFRETFRFEVGYHLRRASTWIYAGLFLLLALQATTGMLVEEAQRAGDLHANAPFSVAMGAVIISWLGMFVTAALCGDAATRDLTSRMHPLFYTAPVSRAAYLGGRWLGAVAVNALLLALVPLGLMATVQGGAVAADLLGPFDPATYLRPYLFLMLPNLLVSAAILFALAVLVRRPLASYGGVLLFFLGSMLSEEVVAEQMGRGVLGSLLDPFGFTALSEWGAYLTPVEQNTQAIGLAGALLWNRVLWLAVACAVLAGTCIRFRFAHPVLGSRRARPEAAGTAPEPYVPVGAPRVAPAFGVRTRVRQLCAVAGRALRALVASRLFLAVAAGGVGLVLVLAGAALTDDYGTPVWPATQFVVRLLSSFLVEVSVVLLTAFYAGELIWHDREAGLSEVVDASPVPDWVAFAGRWLALAGVVVVLQAVLTAAGMLLQVLRGYHDFEVGLYLQVLFGLQLVDLLLFAVLALLVHVLVDQKYVGHVVFLLCYVTILFAGRLGSEHHLLVYGTAPGWVYSDVSGFGPFVAPWLWFKLYGAGWALLFGVVIHLFRVRGRTQGLRGRIRLARLRLTRPVATAAAAGGVLVLATGGFIFYNTNVLHDYRTADEALALRAEYERLYGRYARSPQPQVTGTKLHVELYPARREAAVRGTYRLENRTGVPIDTLHLFAHPDVETGAVDFGRPARMVRADDVRGHRIYVLAAPLQPGDTLRMAFAVRFAPQGFPNEGPNTSVVENGTYFDHTGGRSPNHRRWLPVLGYQPSRELSGEATRRRYGLDPRPAVPSVRDTAALHNPAGREWIDFEAVIGTDADQTAVAPGVLRATWTEGGRRYFRYATDAPVKNAYAIFSARYAVHEARWHAPAAGSAQTVDIQVFHHPGHARNVEHMVHSVRASLDYYTRHFGPYPHRQIRIVEFPRYGHFAYAYPGTIAYAEGFGFLTRVAEGHFDTPFTVVAHEVAHQWWAYQVVPAAVEGAAVLSEVLAQYSAMMVLEQTYGPHAARPFLDQMQIEYLNRRTTRDVPLLRASDQQNIVYRKGALAMYALQAYIGEAAVNTALRRLLVRHRGGEPPYPTALDLYGELRAATPDSLHYLLEDLFEENTLWSLRATAARAEPAGAGRWRVTLDVTARKTQADSTGHEAEVPMDDWVEVGLYDADDAETPRYRQMHRLHSGWQQLTVTVPWKPARAGVDPRGLLIDRDLGGNVVGVKP